MITYSLRYIDPPARAPIDFEAEDASTALIVAHKLASFRDAELWRADRRLCVISRQHEQDWEPAWFVRPERRGMM